MSPTNDGNLGVGGRYLCPDATWQRAELPTRSWMILSFQFLVTSIVAMSSSPIVQLPDFAGTSQKIVEFCNFWVLRVLGV
jgi:hypothetical protein